MKKRWATLTCRQMVEEINEETLHSHELTPKSIRHGVEIDINEYTDEELEDLKRAGLIDQTSHKKSSTLGHQTTAVSGNVIAAEV